MNVDEEPAGSAGPARFALSVDVGGSKLAAALVTRAGDVASTLRIPTPAQGHAEEVFGALTAVIETVLHTAGLVTAGAPEVAGMAVATVGPLDQVAGTVSPVNIAGWRTFPLRDRLADRFGLSVRLVGDAVAVALGEHWRGAARGRRNVLGMVVSTGVGGGVLLDGRVVMGTTGNAGHIGHVSVDPRGPTCVCGGVGCLEAVAGGRSMAAWALTHGVVEEALPGAVTAVAADARGAIVDAAWVAEAARHGNTVALAAYRRAGEAIGLAVAGVVTLLDLDVVVIGGGLAAAGPILFDPISDAYHRHAALRYAATPRVVPAVLGADAGLVGAAAVVWHPLSYWQDGPS